MSQAVKEALKDRLARTKTGQTNNKLLTERVLELAREIASNPVLDARTPDEILGYDEHGIPR
jgi:antitoxin VapB